MHANRGTITLSVFLMYTRLIGQNVLSCVSGDKLMSF